MSRNGRRALAFGATLAIAAGGGTALAGAASTGDDDADDAAQEERMERSSEDITDRAVIERATEAALAETGGGTVSAVEAADDGMTGYEVEVDSRDGTSTEVNLDRDFKVVSVAGDD